MSLSPIPLSPHLDSAHLQLLSKEFFPTTTALSPCSRNVYRYWQNLGGLAYGGWVSPAQCLLSPCGQRELNYWYLPSAKGSHNPVLLVLSTRWQQSPEVLWRRPYEIFSCPHVSPQGSEAPFPLGQPFPLGSTTEHVPECLVPLPHHIAVPTLIPEQLPLSLLCSVMGPTPSTHLVAFPLSAYARKILMP